MLKDKPTLFAFIGLILTSIGIIAPILYSEFANKSELLIQQEDVVTIINKPSEVEGLEILYKREQISSLNKTALRITNNSNIAVTKSDFVSPLQIDFPSSLRIISLEIEEKKTKRYCNSSKR